MKTSNRIFFDESDIRYMVKDQQFLLTITDVEKIALNRIMNDTKNFLGNLKPTIYVQIVKDMLDACKVLSTFV